MTGEERLRIFHRLRPRVVGGRAGEVLADWTALFTTEAQRARSLLDFSPANSRPRPPTSVLHRIRSAERTAYLSPAF